MSTMTQSPVTATPSRTRRVPAPIARQLDRLSNDAVDDPNVACTKDGSMARLHAVRSYVVQHWPEQGCQQVATWFNTWVADLRHSLNLPAIPHSVAM